MIILSSSLFPYNSLHTRQAFKQYKQESHLLVF